MEFCRELLLTSLSFQSIVLEIWHFCCFRITTSEYNLSNSDKRQRLPNIDVEMGSVKENRGTEAETILSDTDDIEAPLVSEKQFTDEDEQTNNSDIRKNPCSKCLTFTLKPNERRALVPKT